VSIAKQLLDSDAGHSGFQRYLRRLVDFLRMVKDMRSQFGGRVLTTNFALWAKKPLITRNTMSVEKMISQPHRAGDC